MRGGPSHARPSLRLPTPAPPAQTDDAPAIGHRPRRVPRAGPSVVAALILRGDRRPAAGTTHDPDATGRLRGPARRGESRPVADPAGRAGDGRAGARPVAD